MTNDEIMEELKKDSILNRCRKIFASESARIEQESVQGHLDPIEHRGEEFNAVKKILHEAGVELD